MSPFGCWGLPVALLALLCCPGSGEVFEVLMSSERLVVEPGMSWKINCSTNCTQPEKGGLETTLNKTLLVNQTQWKQYLVSSASQDTGVYCYFLCSGGQNSKSLNISVFHPPEQVLLTLQPTRVVLGTSFTVECRAPAVAPLERLTLTLLRGKKTLHNKTFEKTMPDPQEAMAMYSATAHREDGHHNFYCKAELDLRSRGGHIISYVSEPRELEVYEPMQNNQMVIIITVVSVLLFLFVTSILLCFVFGQHWHRHRTGNYRVQGAAACFRA